MLGRHLYFANEISVERERVSGLMIYISDQYRLVKGSSDESMYDEVSHLISALGATVTSDRQLSSKSIYLLLLCPGVFSNTILLYEWAWLLDASGQKTHRQSSTRDSGQGLVQRLSTAAKTTARMTRKKSRFGGNTEARPKIVALASSLLPFESYIRSCPDNLRAQAAHLNALILLRRQSPNIHRMRFD